MNIKPIKTKKDYQVALDRVYFLMDAKKNSPESDELEILSMLVEGYEEKHFPIESPDPIAAIEFRMEALGMEKKDLSKILGSRSRASEILNRRRKLSIDMIRNLHSKMQVPAEALIKDYEIRA